MSPSSKIWLIALAVGFTAGWIDWRSRRIPNWLTVGGVVVGIATQTYLYGYMGTLQSVQGMLLGLIILFPLVLLRAMGAGDWKLMAALGAVLGSLMMLMVLLASILLSGVMAAILVIQARRVKETFRNMLVLLQGFLTFGLKTNPEISLDNPTLLKLPFGVAAAMGTFICFLAARRGW